MVSILIVFMVVFFLMLFLLTDSFIVAAFLATIVVGMFFNIDWESETIEAKSDGQISIIINKGIDKANKMFDGGQTVFNEGVQSVLKEDFEKLPIDYYDFPKPEYLDISRRSSTTASFYHSGNYVTVCLDDSTEICFENNYLKTHSDGTKFICETNSEKCYRAK